MAVYDDDARIYADLIRDKNRLKAQIATGGLVSYQVKKDDSGRVTVKDWMHVMRVRSQYPDTWIWDHPSQAIWDISTWDAGSAGDFGRWVDWMRRRWEWSREQDFKQVRVTKQLEAGAIILNATHNADYLRVERVA